MLRGWILQMAGLAVIVLTGVDHGMLSNRWETPDFEGPAQRLAGLPLVIGDWEGRPAAVEALTSLTPASRVARRAVMSIA